MCKNSQYQLKTTQYGNYYQCMKCEHIVAAARCKKVEKKKEEKKETCCICFEPCITDIIGCDTCKIPMHIECINNVIENCVSYDLCPHCRSALPPVFDIRILERTNSVYPRQLPRRTLFFWGFGEP